MRRHGHCGLLFLGASSDALWHVHHDPGFFTHPFYDPATFILASIFAGTSVAVLTYIGFDAISTLSEEVRIRAATSCWPRYWFASLPACSRAWKSMRRNSSGDPSPSQPTAWNRLLPWLRGRPAAWFSSR